MEEIAPGQDNVLLKSMDITVTSRHVGYSKTSIGRG